MENVITQITSGDGCKRKRSKEPVLTRLSSKCGSDKLLASDNGSSAEDSVLESRQSEKQSKRLTSTKRKRELSSFPVSNMSTSSSKDAEDDTSISDSAWRNWIPPEILLRILQLAVFENPQRLNFLMRIMKVCRLWNQVACDLTIWQSLDLAYDGIKDPIKAITSLAQLGRLSQLQHLNVSGHEKANYRFMLLVATEFPQLKSLNISSCSNIRLNSLKWIDFGLKQLRHIDISWINMNSSVMSVGISDIIQSRHDTLEKLEMSGSYVMTQTLSQSIANIKHLTLLDISGMKRCQSNLQILTMLSAVSSHLQILRMSSCRMDQFDLTPDESHTLEQLSFPNLVEFTASWPITNVIRIYPKDSKDLKYLDVGGWKSTELCYLNHVDFPKLTRLSLREVIFSSPFVIHPSAFAGSLEELDISRSKWFPANLFENFISDLIVKGGNLTTLFCARTRLSTNQLKSLLLNCHKLSMIDLDSCRHIDSSLRRLHPDIDALKKTVLGAV